jgi:pre-mRNA-splicing helicase BRR2
MKKPVYWMVAIMTKGNNVLAMALVTVARTLAVRLEFTLPEEGQYELDLTVNCDSYRGLGQDVDLDKIYVGK